jgi:hypothetical protein
MCIEAELLLDRIEIQYRLKRSQDCPVSWLSAVTAMMMIARFSYHCINRAELTVLFAKQSMIEFAVFDQACMILH